MSWRRRKGLPQRPPGALGRPPFPILRSFSLSLIVIAMLVPALPRALAGPKRPLSPRAVGAAQKAPQLYVLTGAVPGVLYSWPHFPEGIQLNNDTGISGLRWSRGSLGAARASGRFSEDLCTKSCAGGPFEKFPVEVVASRPGSCLLEATEVLSHETYQYYRPAYVYTKLVGQVLGGPGEAAGASHLLDLSPNCPRGPLPSSNWPAVDWATSSAPPGALAWGRPRAVSPARGTQLVSCASASSCLVAGGNPSYPGAHGAVVNQSTYWDGTSWSAPLRFGTNATSVTSVSCVPAPAPTARSQYSAWCVAVDDAGDAMIFNGRSWSAPKAADRYGGLGSVSCPRLGSCVAVDYTGHALAFNGRTWGAPLMVDRGGNLRSVSCPTAQFCMAVGSDGRAVSYDGASWSVPRLVDRDGGGLASVSCPSAHFCAAVDFMARALTYDGVSWAGPRYVGVGVAGADSYGGPVSCPSAELCALVDSAGNAFTYNGRAWSVPKFIDARALSSVSCPSSSFCMAVDDHGDAVAGRPAQLVSPTAQSSTSL